MSLLSTCTKPCNNSVFNRQACADEEGFGEEVGIVQGRTAKTSQETKGSPIISARVVPQTIPAALTQEATNSNKMAFLLQAALGDH